MKKSFWDHFDNNIMEYPRSWWRKAWGWRPLYWLRSHTFTRYHIVDCRNDYYDPYPYKWGWYDRCAIILLANFNILVEYMEREHPGDIIAWDSTPEHSAAWKEINELYEWWKRGRKAEHIACSELLDGVDMSWEKMWKPDPENSAMYQFQKPQDDEKTKWDAYSAESDRLDAKDQEMLHRLIEVRMNLWT